MIEQQIVVGLYVTGGFCNNNTGLHALAVEAQKKENNHIKLVAVHGCQDVLGRHSLKELVTENAVTLITPDMFGDGHDQIIQPGCVLGMQNGGRPISEFPHQMTQLATNCDHFDVILDMGGNGSLEIADEHIWPGFANIPGISKKVLDMRNFTLFKTVDGGRDLYDMPIGFEDAIVYVYNRTKEYFNQQQTERVSVIVCMGRDTGYLPTKAAQRLNGLFGLIIPETPYNVDSFASAILIHRHFGGSKTTNTRGMTILVSEGIRDPDVPETQVIDGTRKCKPDILAASLAARIEASLIRYNLLEKYHARGVTLGNSQQTPPIQPLSYEIAKKMATQTFSDLREEFTLPHLKRNTPRHIVYMYRNDRVETLDSAEVIKMMKDFPKTGGIYSSEVMAELRNKGVCFGDLPPLATAYLMADEGFRANLAIRYKTANLPEILAEYLKGTSVKEMALYDPDFDTDWMHKAERLLNAYKKAPIVMVPLQHRGASSAETMAVLRF